MNVQEKSNHGPTFTPRQTACIRNQAVLNRWDKHNNNVHVHKSFWHEYSQTWVKYLCGKVNWMKPQDGLFYLLIDVFQFPSKRDVNFIQKPFDIFFRLKLSNCNSYELYKDSIQSVRILFLSV